MLRDAIYSRVSRRIQESLPMQLSECRRVSERDGALVVAALHDEESGLSETRDGYQEMLRLVRAGAVDRVVVYKMDRFGRDAAEAISRLQELGRLGVSIISASEPTQDPFMQQLFFLLANQESRNISVRTRDRLRHILESEGRWPGPPPFGYAVTPGQPGRAQVEPAEAALVRACYEMYGSGEWSLRALLAWVGTQVDPRTGATWRAATGSPLRPSWLRNLLTRRAYIGDPVWGRVNQSRLIGPRVRRPASEQSHISAAVPLEARGLPPLVDRALFDRVQALLAERAKHRTAPPAGQPTKFLLTSYLHCGWCVAHPPRSTLMIGGWSNPGRARKAGHEPWAYIYLCPRSAHSHGCPMGTRAGRLLDSAVLDLLSGVRFPADMAATLRRRMAHDEATTRARADAERKRATLAAQLARAEARLRQLALDRLDGLMTGERYRSLEESLEADAAALSAELATLAARTAAPLEAAMMVAQQLGDLSRVAEVSLTAQRLALAGCVERVIYLQREPICVLVEWQPWLLALADWGLATLPVQETETGDG